MPEIFSYPLIYIVAAGFLICIAIILFLILKKPFRHFGWGILLFSGGAHWLLFTVFELIADNLKLKLLFSKIQYFGITTVPVTFFILVLYFSGYSTWVRVKKNIYLFILPVITILMVFTNEFHRLHWNNYTLIKESVYYFLSYEYGIWFWVNAGYSYLLLIISYYLLFRHLFRKIRIFKLQASILIIALVFSWLANLIYLLKLFPLKNFDITPIALIFSSAFMIWGIITFKIGDLVPVESELKLDDGKDFLIIIDNHKRVLSISPLAEKVLGAGVSRASGKLVHELVPELKKFKDMDTSGFEDKKISFKNHENKIFVVKTRPLIKSGKTVSGSTLIFRDVTEQVNAENALKESEKKYREIFENVIDGIFRCGLDGILIDCNPALQKMLGYGERRSFLKSIDNIEIYRSFGRNKTLNKNFMLETKLKKKDGSYLWTEIKSRIVKNEEDSYCIGIVRNIDDKKKAEEKINYLSKCDSFTGLYNRHFFEEELKRIDSSNIIPISIMIADINGLKLINGAFGHKKGDEIILMVSVKLREIFKENSILARWGGDEFSAIMPGIDNARARYLKEEASVLFKEFNLGGLELSLAAGVSTKTSEEQKIWEVVRSAEDMMFREKLLEKQSAHGSIIFSLEKALEERNYETAEHVSRLSNLIKNFGAYLSLEPGIIHDLGLLAALHDIGKIAIPDSIVLKPAKLTDEEYDMMKKHSEIGYKIAKSIPEIDPIATTILTHHERWDGKGYPLKLKKENIPLYARILAIVDTFDAITNDRPYRNALLSSEAVSEILKCAGTQFDPVLAEKFAGFLQQFKAKL